MWKDILSEVNASVACPSWAKVCEASGDVAGITPFWVYTLHRWDGEDGGLVTPRSLTAFLFVSTHASTRSITENWIQDYYVIKIVLHFIIDIELYLYSEVFVRLAIPRRGDPSGRVFPSKLTPMVRFSRLSRWDILIFKIGSKYLQNTFKIPSEIWLCTPQMRSSITLWSRW